MDRLVYDRTQADVTNDNWKGQYNPSDLNRVESWCRYLIDQLTAVGYSITNNGTPLTTKTTWVQTDPRTSAEMERIRQNILKIMTSYHWITPIYNTAEQWDYIKANRWELILHEIAGMMNGMENWYVYGGVARGGQPRLWQHRFRQLFTIAGGTWAELQDYTWRRFHKRYLGRFIDRRKKKCNKQRITI